MAAGHTGLTVGAVVHPGAVVAVDDSPLVHSLLDDLLAARPRVVGTASIAALTTLTAARAARTGHLRVRLFGGELRRTAGSCGGAQAVRAVTATAVDVALVGGRVVGTDVWVPAGVRDTRLALVLAARRAYVVLAADDTHPDASDTPVVTVPADARETRLAALTVFDGVIEVAGTADLNAFTRSAG